MGKLIMKKLNKTKNNQGQVAILVLLVSAVLLTLGLSASKKTILDTKINTDEELLKEAFNAAESGINNYITNNVGQYSDNSGGNAVVSSVDIGGNTNELVTEGIIPVNTSEFFWLVSHKDSDGTVDLNNYYNSNSFSISVDTDFTGALKITYFYLTVGGVYESKTLGRNFGSGTFNGFTSVPSGTDEVTLTVDPGSKPLLLVVTPLGGSTKLTLSGASTFPKQGQELTSVGSVGDGIKTQIKTRNVYQIPLFFTEAVTVKNNIQ